VVSVILLYACCIYFSISIYNYDMGNLKDGVNTITPSEAYSLNTEYKRNTVYSIIISSFYVVISIMLMIIVYTIIKHLRIYFGSHF